MARSKAVSVSAPTSRASPGSAWKGARDRYVPLGARAAGWVGHARLETTQIYTRLTSTNSPKSTPAPTPPPARPELLGRLVAAGSYTGS